MVRRVTNKRQTEEAGDDDNDDDDEGMDIIHAPSERAQHGEWVDEDTKSLI